MSISEKLLRAKTDYDEVYEAGKQAEYDRFWDSFQQNGTRESYYYAFSGPGWTEETLKPKYKVKPIEIQYADQYCMGLFFHCNRGNSTTFDFRNIANLFDFSQTVNAVDLFGESQMDYIVANLQKATCLSRAFAQFWGAHHTNITLTVSERCVDYSHCFASSTKLTNLIFTDGSVIAENLDLSSCPLSKTSIISVINALSGSSGGKLLKLKQSAVDIAFETSDGAADGNSSQEWKALTETKSNWKIELE